MDNQIEKSFINYVARFDSFQQRSMFGGTGLFSDDAMYVLIFNDVIFLRGGGVLDKKFEALNCSRYQHVKKQCVATVNYFDITKLFLANMESHLNSNETHNRGCHDELKSIIKESISYAKTQREAQKSEERRRLRDLPNMQLTLERMLKSLECQMYQLFFKCNLKKYLLKSEIHMVII